MGSELQPQRNLEALIQQAMEDIGVPDDTFTEEDWGRIIQALNTKIDQLPNLDGTNESPDKAGKAPEE